MAEADTGGGGEDDDVEVVWEGSPLHQHLSEVGLSEKADSEKLHHVEAEAFQDEEKKLEFAQGDHERSVLLSSARSFMWPQDSPTVLEVKVAQAILDSELLVQEDEDFVSNFILTEDVLAEFKEHVEHEERQGTSSFLGDILLFSGSVAAMAGAVLYLSERARAATAAAAILPTALAAMSSVRINSKVSQTKEEEHFHKLISLLLADMKLFKQLVRKSLNLLQGMEMVSTGVTFSVNTETGGASSNQPPASSPTKLSRGLDARGASTFPALRLAAHKCTVQLIQAYRDAVEQLMKVSPLADHVDLREHYIAFVDLENFGILVEQPTSCDDLSVKELKETAQVALVQQSEYLRRFSLVFCERVREDNDLNKAGVLKHIRDLVATIRTINGKLARVFDYHQAMGVDLEASKKQKALVGRKKTFLPLRSIYTSVFSTGLHLRNSLLTVRHLEKIFDSMEENKKPNKGENAVVPVVPPDRQLVEWLRGFQQIQAELNACVGCLDEAVAQIDVLQDNKTDDETTRDLLVVNDAKVDATESDHYHNKIVVDYDADEEKHLDEVYEAVIRGNDEEDLLLPGAGGDVDKGMMAAVREQSDRVLRELKQVLIHRAADHQAREAEALSRKYNGNYCKDNQEEDAFGMPRNKKVHKGGKRENNSFEDSFMDHTVLSNNVQAAQVTSDEVENGYDEDEDTSSSTASQCPTVKSFGCANDDKANIARSVSGQLLDDYSDDEECFNEIQEDFVSSTTEEVVTVNDTDTESDEVNGRGDDYRKKLTVMSLTDLQQAMNEEDEVVKNVKDIRSLSTPDLKQLSCCTLYVNLEAGAELLSRTKSGSSSDWGSADEMDRHVLKSYRRPLRPAAVKSKLVVGEDEERKMKQRKKRLRNRSCVMPSLPTSKYVTKHQNADNPLTLPPSRPSGFEGSLAAQVAARAKLFVGNGGAVFGNDLGEEVVE